MIRHRTVIVVGAGGSCAYGFPSGQQLLLDAKVTSIKGIQDLTRNYYPNERIEIFRAALIGCQSDSMPLRHVPFGAAHAGENIDSAIANLIERAANGIKIVHQADGTTDEFSRARAALHGAERVVFLGFSFGRANVDRLDFNCIGPGALPVCSRYGMTTAEVAVQIVEPVQADGTDRSHRIVC